MLFNHPLLRPPPSLPAGMMQTHQILAPTETHWRKATCAEVACPHYLNGWMLHTNGLDADDIAAAKTSGRRFRAESGDTGEVLVFEPGQPCFRASTHQVRLERPELFIARDGDWRGNPRGTDPTRFSGADAWTDSLHTHLEQFERGN